MNPTRIVAALSVLAICCVLPACSRNVRHTHTTRTVVEKHGPPPYAPAHGYRHKHDDGVILIYDASLTVYLVEGYSAHYYHGKYYYRLHGGNWEIAKHFKGPWHPAGLNKLPPGLRKDHASNDKRDKGNNGKTHEDAERDKRIARQYGKDKKDNANEHGDQDNKADDNAKNDKSKDNKADDNAKNDKSKDNKADDNAKNDKSKDNKADDNAKNDKSKDNKADDNAKNDKSKDSKADDNAKDDKEKDNKGKDKK